jgi:lipopolysaccharide assembly outer membrane protein LptD (OstA)
LGRLVAAWIVFIVCAAAPGAADEVESDGGQRFFQAGVPVELRADSLEYETGRDLYVASGNVRIRQADRELRADWMAFSNGTRQGVASGDVVYTDGTDTVTTEFVEFNVDTLEGVMFDAEFDVPSNRLEMRGVEVAKTGDRTYTFKQGSFTTCRCPDPEAREPWQIEAEEADLEVEGYGVTRNTTVEILGVPVLWLPWMIYPLKSERQSGLLFPDFGVGGRNGFEVGLPVFWALGDPVNLIFTPRWLQKRGAKADVDLEYVLGQRSGGHLFGSFIYDRDVDPGTRRTPFGKERWGTSGGHDLFLPFDWRFQTEYAFASDNAHPTDFQELRRYRWDRFMPATAFATRPFGATDAFGLVVGARLRDDLQNPDDTDRDDFLLQRWLEASYHALPAALPFASWLVPALDLHYAWFGQGDRPEDVYTGDAGEPWNRLVEGDGRFFDSGIDGISNQAEQGRTGSEAPPDLNEDDFDEDDNPTGTEGDKVFQEGELLADDGHRLLFMPRLGLAFRLADALELYPEVGWHQTLYQSDAQALESRGFLTGRLDLRTRLRRRFGDVTHLLEPRLGWAYVHDTSQFGNPLYVPPTAVPQRRLRELDLENVTRDTADRIAEFHGVTLGLGNRFYAGPGGPSAGARLLGDFVLSALYDIEAGEFGGIYLDGRAYPFRGATARFNVGFDPEEMHIDEGLAAIHWWDDRGDRVNLGYRYLRDIPRFFEAFPVENDRFENYRTGIEQVHQIDGGFRIAITRQWGITYRAAYTFEQNLLLANQGGIEYLSKCRCWAVRLEISETRSRGVQFNVLYTLVGIGDDSRSPFEGSALRRSLGLLDGF